MKILVINAGSSSLKYQLFEKKGNLNFLFKGIIERIGQKGKIKNHHEAVKKALNTLKDKHIINDLKEIKAVGHRVVHGGEKYVKPTIITPKIQKEIQKLCKLAPLHNPPNLSGIKACKTLLKNVKQIAVFDTSFHQTIEPKAFLYALPYKYYDKLGIRKYGFHGTSHQYVSKETIKLLKKKSSKIITCHLGNGSSVTAIKNGKSIDTSMGFTPLEGLPMGTRCGNIDPAIPAKLMEILKKSPEDIDKILNKSSGLKGISELSSDMRDLWKAYKTNKKARLAISILSYKIAQYIGGYAASLNGLDAITFTGGIGEKADYVRKETCDYLSHLGVKLDIKKNKACEKVISSKNSKIKVFVIPTNEEKEIADQTLKVLKK